MTPTPHDAVNHILETIALTLPHTTQAQRYNYARISILASIVTDAQTNIGRRVRYYADQLDRINLLTSQ